MRSIKRPRQAIRSCCSLVQMPALAWNLPDLVLHSRLLIIIVREYALVLDVIRIKHCVARIVLILLEVAEEVLRSGLTPSARVHGRDGRWLCAVQLRAWGQTNDGYAGRGMDKSGLGYLHLADGSFRQSCSLVGIVGAGIGVGGLCS